jgi:hypothetical protein
VSGRVAEDRELLVLGGDVHDGVRHQVDQRERAFRPGGGHIADEHGDGLSAGFRQEPLSHVRRQLDSRDGNSLRAERERDPPGADAELKSGAIARQFGEKAGDRPDDGRLGLPRVHVVVHRRELRVPGNRGHGAHPPASRLGKSNRFHRSMCRHA